MGVLLKYFLIVLFVFLYHDNRINYGRDINVAAIFTSQYNQVVLCHSTLSKQSIDPHGEFDGHA